MKLKRQSKTLWINTITLIVSVVSAIAGSDLVADHPQAAAIAAAVLSVANIALRFVTSVPVEPMKFEFRKGQK